MASNGAANSLAHPPNDPLLNDEAKGAVVHTFDVNASPSEKAASAGKGQDKLKSAAQQDASNGGREVQIDNGKSNVVPTIVIHDTEIKPNDKAAPSESPATATTEEAESSNDGESVPGAMPGGPSTGIPDWYKVGWREMSGIDTIPDEEAREKRLLETFISEQYYGDWYHSAGIIVFAVFTSHFLTRFGFGFGWLLVLLAICNTYYSTSMQRLHRHSRDDIQRELVKTRLASEHESADWINNFLDRFWKIYEPVLSKTIVGVVDQVLSANAPAFLDSLRLAEFTLGNKAPRIEKVRTFPQTEDDVVMMDWGISFTPNDVEQMTHEQSRLKVNPKIVLAVRLGKGLASAVMPILLEDITFSGLIRIRMKLMNNFPHVQIVDISFLEKPVIDFVLKPIGGETFGFDINNIPGLSTFIRETTHSVMGPMMYDPNVFTLNLEQMLSGTPLDAAIGVLQVTLHTARGLKGVKIGGGSPDPYVSVSINDRAELARTKYKSNTYNPTWSETKFILINSLSEHLTLSVWDYNDHRKNALLGSTSFELGVLNQDSTQEDIHSQLLKDGKDRGELRYDVSYYPVLTPEDGQTELPETSVGIVRLTIHQAKKLDSSKSMSGDLNPIAKVFLGGQKQPIHVTNTTKHTLSPIWESSHEFLCTDKASSIITVKVIDDRDFLKDPVIGYMSISLVDLLASKQEGKDWFPLSNCKSGTVRVSAEWKPLNMAGSLHGADQYTPPIGIVRLLLDRATDVKNVEATLGGKSDPYVRVLINNDIKGRTEVINNNLNPIWDQIVYIPVHSMRERLLLECMDYQHLTKDRSLGSVELRVSDLAKESEDQSYPFESLGPKDMTEPLHLDKGEGFKGTLHYRAEFVPALKLKNLKFDHVDASPLSVGHDGDTDGGTVSDGASSVSSSDEEFQEVPVGVTYRLQHQRHRPKKSIDTTASVDPSDTAPQTPVTPTTNTSTTPAESFGVEMSTEELLTHQSGLVVVNVMSGQLAKKARLEVLLDNAYWPSFSTQRAQSVHATWTYAGEGFLKELDFGQIWLRLNEADEGNKDDIVAQWRGDAKAFLQSTLEGPHTFELFDDEGKNRSTITVESRYVPVPVKLEARESINNQGVVRVNLLNGHGLHAADRGGKSDPFAVFTLNGQKVFKSDTKKKTLDPEWNEEFSVQVQSRVGSQFEVELFDWNQIEQAKSLGSGTIDLNAIEPFEALVADVPLKHHKHGDCGHIKVRMNFQPEIIVKSRSKTSTFSTAGRALTQVGGMPVNAGKGVLHGVTGIFGKKEKDDGIPNVPSSLPAGQSSNPIPVDFAQNGGSRFNTLTSKPSSEAMSASGTNEPGTLRVTVVEAKDLSTDDAKPYVTLRIGDKEQKTKHTAKTASPEWNETFTFTAGPLTPKVYAWVHDHKTLGKDKLLGEAEIDIWRHLQPASGVHAADVSVELKEGTGLLKLQLSFDSTPVLSRTRTGSINSRERSPRVASISMASPSRFSLSRNRKRDEDD